MYRGGFGDVWKCDYRKQEVAVKVVRTYADSDLQKVTRVSDRWSFAREMLTVISVEILQGVHNVESSPPSERVAVARGDNVGHSVRDGVEVDAKRKH